MRFDATGLDGLRVVRPDTRVDERGSFARVFCQDDFAKNAVPFVPVQMSVSFNRVVGTLRGLHWQAEPCAETKLVRVTRGRIFDVAVDLRPGSRTRLGWFGLELDEHSHTSLLIPPGFAHGFITLMDACEVLYAMDTPHAPGQSRGARWDDPVFGVKWPLAPRVMSDRDRTWPDFVPDTTGA